MNNKVNLICLPFAGGNKYSYRSLFSKKSKFFNPTVVEYPGRGSRVFEKLVSNIDIIVDDIYDQIKRTISNGEYAIYGHSLGGLIAYLLTVKILQAGHYAPKHVFITGAAGPSAKSRTTKQLYLYPQKEFINEVIELGGIPDGVFQYKDMVHFLEPILRNDFKVSATYVYKEDKPLDIPLTVITGTEEDITPEDILLWQKESSQEVDFKQMTGNHFFINDHETELIDIISKKLTQPLEIFKHE
jgi:external thioesterase TEII